MVLISNGPASAEGRVKVHKDLITVSPADAKGVVRIEGSAGAIANPANVTLRIENLTT